MARQLLRLHQTRASGTYNDQLSPAEILQAEILASNAEEYLDFVISQLRQVLGTADWKDSVPITLAAVAALDTDVVAANCLASDTPGDFVYVTGAPVSGKYQTSKVDVMDPAKMPAWGTIQSKSAPTECIVRHRGVLSGVYTGLIPQTVYAIGIDGRPVAGVSSIPSRGFRQLCGIALSDSELLLKNTAAMVRVA